MPLCLLGTLRFGVSAGPFRFSPLALSLFGLGRVAANVLQVLLVSEVEDKNHRDGDYNYVQPCRLNVCGDETGDDPADNIGHRSPDTVPGPYLPKRLSMFQRHSQRHQASAA